MFSLEGPVLGTHLLWPPELSSVRKWTVGDKLCWVAGRKRPEAHLLISLSTIPITHGPRWDSGGARWCHSIPPSQTTLGAGDSRGVKIMGWPQQGRAWFTLTRCVNRAS